MLGPIRRHFPLASLPSWSGGCRTGECRACGLHVSHGDRRIRICALLEGGVTCEGRTFVHLDAGSGREVLRQRGRSAALVRIADCCADVVVPLDADTTAAIQAMTRTASAATIGRSRLALMETLLDFSARCAVPLRLGRRATACSSARGGRRSRRSGSGSSIASSRGAAGAARQACEGEIGTSLRPSAGNLPNLGCDIKSGPNLISGSVHSAHRDPRPDCNPDCVRRRGSRPQADVNAAAAKRPSLKVTLVQPFTLAGRGFKARERIRISADGSRKSLRASATGGFVARLVAADPCNSFAILAVGNRAAAPRSRTTRRGACTARLHSDIAAGSTDIGILTFPDRCHNPLLVRQDLSLPAPDSRGTPAEAG